MCLSAFFYNLNNIQMNAKFLVVTGRIGMLFRKEKVPNFISPFGTRKLPKDFLGRVMDKDHYKLPAWNKLRNKKGK